MFAFLCLQHYNKTMYLVSLYFDEKTNRKLTGLMKNVAQCCGNTDMIDKTVPPHITLTAFESKERQEVLAETLGRVCSGALRGNLMWVSVAAFFPHVLYLMPVQNRYLCELSEKVCREIAMCSDTSIQECYKPFEWIPHTTVARKLSEEQMREAFAALQKAFVPFEGTVVRIGLSTGSPKRELASWDLVSNKGGFKT